MSEDRRDRLEKLISLNRAVGHCVPRLSPQSWDDIVAELEYLWDTVSTEPPWEEFGHQLKRIADSLEGEPDARTVGVDWGVPGSDGTAVTTCTDDGVVVQAEVQEDLTHEDHPLNNSYCAYGMVMDLDHLKQWRDDDVCVRCGDGFGFTANEMPTLCWNCEKGMSEDKATKLKLAALLWRKENPKEENGVK